VATVGEALIQARGLLASPWVFPLLPVFCLVGPWAEAILGWGEIRGPKRPSAGRAL